MSLHYIPPPASSLQNVAFELEMRYQQELALRRKKWFKLNDDHSSQRLAFIAILKLIPYQQFTNEQSWLEIMVGAALFEKRLIKKNNLSSFVLNFLKNNFRFNSNNHVSPQQEMVYLYRWYHYVEYALPDAEITSLCWPNKKKLLSDIEEVMREVKKQIEHAGGLGYTLPSVEVLQKNILALPEKYQEAISKKFRLFKNNNHLNLIRFMVLICRACMEIYPNEYLQKKTHDPKIDYDYWVAHQIMLGLVFFALHFIKAEIKMSLHAESGELFPLCLTMVGLKKLTDLDAKVQIIFLSALKLFKEMIKIRSSVYAAAEEEWKKNKIDLNYFCQQIDEIYFAEEVNQRQLSLTGRFFSRVIDYGAQYSLGFLATNLARRAALPFLTGMTTGGVGLTAIIIYDAAGTIFFTQLGRAVCDAVVPQVIVGSYNWLLERSGEFVAQGTVGVSSFFCRLTKETFAELFKRLKPKEKEFLADFFEVALKLPESVMSEREKDQIRDTFCENKEFKKAFICN